MNLVDPNGVIQDSQTFVVNTSATVIKNDFANQTTKSDEVLKDPDTMDGNCPKCKSVFDIFCILWNYECNLSDFIKTVVVLLVIVVVTFAVIRKCVLCRIIKWCVA